MPVTTNTRKLAALLGASGAGIGTDGLMQPAGIDADMATQAELDAIPEYDDTSVRQDISILALREAVTENRVANNLPNSFIDQFQDDSGIGTETDVDRNASEYVETDPITGVGDANTVSLIHSDTTNGSTTFTDSSRNGTTQTVSGTPTHSTAITAKFGTSSMKMDGVNERIQIPNNISSGDPQMPTGAEARTVDFWAYLVDTDPGFLFGMGNGTAAGTTFGLNIAATGKWIFQGNGGAYDFTTTFSAVTGAWIHIAIVYTGTRLHMFFDGVDKADQARSLTTGSGDHVTIGASSQHSSGIEWSNHYYDEFRVSNIARWTSDFTPPTAPYAPTTKTATGTLIGTANVPSSAQTKVSGVMLYKDAYGTATPGTHLKIYFTCNGGTNWTEAASYTAVTPVFSTGIKMVKLGETTCTSGSDVRYKAGWASQVISSLDTQLHGIGLNY